VTRPSTAERASGVLLHLTSLPGPHGSGDLGPSARAFVDFLARAGQRHWQTLPIQPVGAGYSPYSGVSAFAGNPLLISLEDLVSDRLLEARELPSLPSTAAVDYPRSIQLRERALRQAYVRYRERRKQYAAEREELRTRHAFWLDDYTLFTAARAHHRGQSFTAWPSALARRQPSALREARERWADEVEFAEFTQLMFDRQWRTLRACASAQGVALIGDVPIFLAHDSADVWSHPAMFRLDEQGEPTHVSGVPPDYFSETGQRWGTPLYDWSALAGDDYRFWVQRMRTLLERFDVVRLDHFIGFARYWEIPAHAETAVEGRWVKGPGAPLFERLMREFGGHAGALPLIAEDLGCVNRSVRTLRRSFALPGMRVLQFGFAADDTSGRDHLPHNFPRRAVAYTGTHDTNTIVGWFNDPGGTERTPEQTEADRRFALAYLHGPGQAKGDSPIHLAMIRVLFSSPAHTVIVPIQDWLGLDATSRMNVPGKAEGNWAFRLTPGALSESLAALMRDYARTYGRYSWSHTESEPAGQVNSAAP
jgi:4-alpha-glucanotransferase